MRDTRSSNLEFGNHLSIWLKTEENQETCVEVAGRSTFRIHADF
jgi:hypothetical protein